MRRRVVLGLLLLVLLVVPEARGSGERVEGFASAYGPGVFEDVVRLRMVEGWWRVRPPGDWYTVAGYIAAMDCSRVGEVTTLTDPGGREWRVLIGDCAGDDGPVDRFEKMGVVAELDHGLWTRLTEEHGRPLRIGIGP